jgi:hypothetical protein
MRIYTEAERQIIRDNYLLMDDKSLVLELKKQGFERTIKGINNKRQKLKLFKSFEEEAKKRGGYLGNFELPNDIPRENRLTFYTRAYKIKSYLGHIDTTAYFVYFSVDEINSFFQKITDMYKEHDYSSFLE